jgi:hypothetical protein
MARAAQTTEVTGEVVAVEHAGTSVNGNPSYRLILTGEDAGSYVTAVDAMCGYGASNYAPRRDRQPVPVVLTLNARGRVVRITRPDGSDA